MGKNEKIYKTYRMFGYDYLFYYAMIFLFVTVTKDISVGNYMYLCSIYAIFFAIFQIPLNYLVESIGLKKSMVLGNAACVIHCIIYIISNKFWCLAIAECFCALGFALKGLTETQILYSSLKKSGRESRFAKTEGKGVARYYYLEAIGSVLVGFLYTVNDYIPIILTLISLIISLIISTKFEEVPLDINSDYSGIKTYFRDFRRIFRSERLLSIFIFALFMTGLVEVIKTIQKSVLVELYVPASIYSIIIAFFTLCTGIGSRIQDRAEKHTNRKMLTMVGILIPVLVFALGLINSQMLTVEYKKYISVILLSAFNVMQGLYRISIKKYLNNFTTSEIRGKILAIFYIFEGIGKSVLLFVSGLIIDDIGTNYTNIIIGISMLIIFIVILKYMKTRLGLNPEEYNKTDLCGKTVSELTKK